MVLIEAMAGGTPVVAAASGAIPEVLAGQGTLFEPGDWRGLARVLADGAPAPRDRSVLERFSVEAAAERTAAAYARVLGG
jgi:glycosyltransferase involved in cell wall biosynthesis